MGKHLRWRWAVDIRSQRESPFGVPKDEGFDATSSMLGNAAVEASQYSSTESALENLHAIPNSNSLGWHIYYISPV
jgi:hypothetical protein